MTKNHFNNKTLDRLASGQPFLWINPNLHSEENSLLLTTAHIRDAENRLNKFAPLLAKLFPELEKSKGIIESELLQVPSMLSQLNSHNATNIPGKLWVKADHELPVAGSVKARGGIYEVLCFAEQLALENNIIEASDDYSLLANANARDLFAQYTVLVSSTGNLGLSIGVMSAALGFKVCVHMSVEAKEWKKERLRKKGVVVIEHAADYSKAVAAGRDAAESDPFAYFVDDENSERLFLGYSVAALRLERQLQEAGVIVDEEHPLFIYIPCGVGGAPGGITFGLKQIYGNAVHCFFAEPTQAPCMLLGMSTNFEEEISVYDVGLKVDTEADGLAVSKASLLVGKMMNNLLSGIFTVEDDRLFMFLYRLQASELLKIEPSAAAGFAGPDAIINSEEGKQYILDNGLEHKLQKANHIVWTTGGRFVPDVEYLKFKTKGEALCTNN